MSEEKRQGHVSEDNELVKACCAGRKRAFDDLVLKYQDKLFNLCYWFLGDYQEASDMAQETLIKVYRSLHTFRFESAFSTWLYRIAINTCKNRVHSLEYRYKKWMDRLDPAETRGFQAPENGQGDLSDSPLQKLENKEQGMMIRRAINSLPHDRKTVAVLRDIEGLSYDEIAGITGFPVGTVKSKLSRARLALQSKLKGKM